MELTNIQTVMIEGEFMPSVVGDFKMSIDVLSHLLPLVGKNETALAIGLEILQQIADHNAAISTHQG